MEPVLHSTPTIVAVASPPGRSPRGLLRVSGPGTGQVLRRLLCAVPVAMRELLPVRLADPALPGLLVRFAAPASYTGEDAAELQVPGNAALLDRLLHLAIAADATGSTRLAEPGEFTFRAYTAGKLDLTQAEGVAATIHATSDSQLRAATLLREGRLGRAANGYVDTLGNLLALVEAGIDFTDQEDVVPIAPSELLHHLSTLYVQLQDTLSNSRPWGAVESLPRVVLVGPPSAGKSTLFNALLGRERAVMDPMPGTTRDVLAEPLRLMTLSGQPVEVMLVDIAGLDHGIGLLDTAAQRAAEAAIRRADLLLYLTPRGGRSPEPNWDLPTLRVLTMMDRPECSRDPINQDWGVSAHTGEGLEQLKALIARHVGRLAVSVNAEMLTLQPRHEAGLRSAAAHLGTACSVLSGHQGSAALPDIELLADTMRAALDALAGLGGRLTPDEVIGRVFATFCVGK